MACVTLKRPIDVLGSPHLAEIQPLAKRKRCGPPLFAATPTPTSRGVKRAKRRLDVDEAYLPNSGPASPVQSPFSGVVPPVEPEKLAARMELEFKRLQRRRLFAGDGESSGPSSLPGSPGGSGSSSSTGAGHTTSASSSNKDQPLFTLKQVTMVCQRMLKEREEQVRVEFAKILETKLAEQYDTFVKFTHDQVERRLAESAFSYLELDGDRGDNDNDQSALGRETTERNKGNVLHLETDTKGTEDLDKIRQDFTTTDTEPTADEEEDLLDLLDQATAQ